MGVLGFFSQAWELISWVWSLICRVQDLLYSYPFNTQGHQGPERCKSAYQCHLVDPAPDSKLRSSKSPSPGQSCQGCCAGCRTRMVSCPPPPWPHPHACSAPFFPPQLPSPPLDLSSSPSLCLEQSLLFASPLPAVPPILWGSLSSSLALSILPWHPQTSIFLCVCPLRPLSYDSLQLWLPPGSSPWGRGQHHAVHRYPHSWCRWLWEVVGRMDGWMFPLL